MKAFQLTSKSGSVSMTVFAMSHKDAWEFAFSQYPKVRGFSSLFVKNV